MAKKQQLPQPDAGESRAAIALTVVWMLTCMSTVVGLLFALGLRLLGAGFPVPAGRPHPLGQMAAVLLFVTIATGVLCLALTPLAWRVRQSPPPRSITIAAVVIGLLPIVVAVAGALGSR